MRVLLTGGHVTPLLAVISELQKQPNIDIVVVTRRYSGEGSTTPAQESLLLQEGGIRHVYLQTGRLQRHISPHSILSLTKVPFGLLKAMGILSKEKPDIVVSFGGYLSVPMCMAAAIKRIPILTHEQSARAGLANRINATVARRVAISFASSKQFFPPHKTILTGNPVRPEIYTIQPDGPEISRLLQAEPALPILYITGGNQGAHAINLVIFDLLSIICARFRVLHQTGSNHYHDYETAVTKREALPEYHKNRYLPQTFIGQRDIGAVLNQATLLISRSGANTVSEIASLGKVAIFIPLPFAQQNEQYENASLLADRGSARILPQDQLSPERLKREIDEIMANFDTYNAKAQQAKPLSHYDAAAKIVKEIMTLARGKTL